jgi:predicted acylesterase/phospholipase RssA
MDQTQLTDLSEQAAEKAPAITPLEQPFQKIALALSGGGFRAASYSIGTMSYLHHIPYDEANNRSLLDNVVFISSASGGSFANMLYSMYAKKGIPFLQAYHDLLQFMNGQTLLDDVLSLANNDQQWQSVTKSRNFINAFARIYNDRLFKGETFGVYWNTTRDIEVCVNATEFHRGLSFRFQTDGKTPANPMLDEKTGNAYVYFDKSSPENLQTVQQLKLGDILAASSCFPGGFEPILFPTDFTHANLNAAALQQAMVVKPYNEEPTGKNPQFGLMDGGINDNQALYSAMLADKRLRNKTQKGYDLVIVTDVASYFVENPYQAPSVPTDKWAGHTIAGLMTTAGKKLRSLSNVLRWAGAGAAFLLLLAVILLVTQSGKGNTAEIIGYILIGPAVLVLALALLLTQLKNNNPIIGQVQQWATFSNQQIADALAAQVPAVKNFSVENIELFITYIRQAPLGVLSQLGIARLNSLLSMAMDINLKQTRRLIFDLFYGEFQEQSPWQNRQVFNVIYELSSFNNSGRTMNFKRNFGKFKKLDAQWYEGCQKLLMEGCDKLNQVAEGARTMGTTLWFDKKDADEDRLKTVVACGQFTTCLKLLEYILLTEKKMQTETGLPESQRTIIFDVANLALFNRIKEQVTADWTRFKGDPFFLYNEYQPQKTVRLP